MAMSGVHYQLLIEHAPLLKRGGHLLEIGEANWYGDIAPPPGCEGADLFQIARAVYGSLFAPASITSVDVNGSDSALRQDLNRPLVLSRLFDVAINNGTAEHVFNIGQVFESMHQWTRPGGVMIHDAPFVGWCDHGFFTLQPTLFYDLAAANDYELISLTIAEIRSGTVIRIESRDHLHSLTELPINSMLYVVLRKCGASKFRFPMQGYYDGRLSELGERAWQAAR